MEILQLHLPCLDLDRAASFYGDLLELPTERTSQELALQIGSSKLLLFKSNEASPQHFAFNVAGDRFSESKAWLAQRVALHRDKNGQNEFDFPDWNARAAYFRDPDGNILEIIARVGIPKRERHPLLSISEIGIACNDVTATVETLRSNFGLEPYRPLSPDFAAVGDENGLLILARNGREWYPETGIPALPTSGEVSIQTQTGTYLLALNAFAAP